MLKIESASRGLRDPASGCLGQVPARTCRARPCLRPVLGGCSFQRKEQRPRQCNGSHLRRTRCTASALEAVEAAVLVGPVVEAFHGVSDCYSFALQQCPQATKAGTTVLTYGVGDLMAQRADCRRVGRSFRIDPIRLRNFMISGAGAGLLWSWWYDFLDMRLHEVGIQPGAEATAISIIVETFVWAPIFFGIYFLPVTSVLKWGSLDKIMPELQAEIWPTLVANAKVWTPLNLVIYNAPLPIRVLVSNSGDLLWSAYLSFLVQDACDEGDEYCLAEKDDIACFIREETLAEVGKRKAAVSSNNMSKQQVHESSASNKSAVCKSDESNASVLSTPMDKESTQVFYDRMD